ncbi:FAD binding domain-containing protein [Chloroflexota bacterium]
MRSLEFLEPTTLTEACSLLSKYKDEARLISGGQSLVPILKLRLISPKYLIDLKGINALDFIRENDDCLSIGALTTEREIETSDIIKRRFPILAEAVHTIGSVQIRNWGTIGGSLAHADPAGDIGPVLMALRSRVKAKSTRGEREISLEEYFTDYFESALEPDEILTEVTIPYLPSKSGGVYAKEINRVGDTGICSMAVVVSLKGNDEVKKASIVLGCQSKTPIRAINTEEIAIGRKANDSMMELEKTIVKEVNPVADVLGSIEYKVDLVRITIKQALPKAIIRAQAT